MSLTPGTRLGPYEVVESIGRGGPPSLARVGSASFGVARRSPARTS